MLEGLSIRGNLPADSWYNAVLLRNEERENHCFFVFCKEKDMKVKILKEGKASKKKYRIKISVAIISISPNTKINE